MPHLIFVQSLGFMELLREFFLGDHSIFLIKKRFCQAEVYQLRFRVLAAMDVEVTFLLLKDDRVSKFWALFLYKRLVEL